MHETVKEAHFSIPKIKFQIFVRCFRFGPTLAYIYAVPFAISHCFVTQAVDFTVLALVFDFGLFLDLSLPRDGPYCADMSHMRQILRFQAL